MVAAGNNGKNDEDILRKDRRSVYGVKPAFESNETFLRCFLREKITK